MKALMDYIPKGKRHWVEAFWHDSDGYWLVVGEAYWCDYMDCHTIHEDTIKEVLQVFKSVRPSTPTDG